MTELPSLKDKIHHGRNMCHCNRCGCVTRNFCEGCMDNTLSVLEAHAKKVLDDYETYITNHDKFIRSPEPDMFGEGKTPKDRMNHWRGWLDLIKQIRGDK